MSTPETIKQRKITVKDIAVGEDIREVVVRRMRWKPAKEFLAAIAKQVSTLGDLSLTAESILPRMSEVLGVASGLTEQLIADSTDLTLEQIGQIDTLDIGELVEAALKLNMGPELKKCWAGISANLGRFLRTTGEEAPTTSGATSTPTSSMPATPQVT